MDAEKYNRTISMLCPTCGGTQFAQSKSDAGPIETCARCGRSVSREELIRENSENIAEHVNEVKREVVKDAQKEIRDMLKKSFGRNKNLRIR
jgi:CRISPR/Cas system-associated protein Cas10 (large subunit of type III CRISPR-Cas system)